MKCIKFVASFSIDAYFRRGHNEFRSAEQAARKGAEDF